ncbi:MAG: MupA/Atu3671 family FMN-dependent luciferase-like monooxygenase [Gammaproteobacteria bacterium]|jgi:natural product biosynthesis luciferase-like monooxygenase protein|nr:MupA/Atu3671 family FMN-dependent luciferase-like monooxygenase [Gammaproteobacteria bacterium]
MSTDAPQAYPLTSTQQGMLFHHISNPGSGVDIEQIVCSLTEELDVALLQQAWSHVIARHPALRTRFRWEDADDPEQQPEAEVYLSLRSEDWRQRPAEAREAALQALLDEERSRGFDLREAPCLRVAAIRTGEQAWEVLWTFHHIVCDGRSFPLVLAEVFGCYDALKRGAVCEGTPAPAFAEHARYVNNLSHNEAERFWRDRLTGFAATTPLPAPAVAAPVGKRRHADAVLPETLTSGLQSLAAAAGCSLNTVVQGAWALLLGRWSTEQDVVFGATRAGRAGTVDKTGETVGCFINTLPVRVALDHSGSIADWLQGLRDSERAVRDHDQSPLMAVQGWSEVGSGQPLFESIIVYDHQTLDSQMKALGDGFAERHFRLIERTNYPLTLYAYGEPRLVLKLAYDEPRFDAALAERLMAGLVHILETMAADPAAELSSVQLLSADDKQRVLFDWNDTATPYPETMCIHQAIEAQAEKTPDATALVFRDQAISYAELNSRANRLAYFLLGLGVGRDVPVALCAHRGIELMVALLAIHKAGGAYLPLDPAYPRDRLSFMIEDAEAPVLLTQSSLEHLLGGHRAHTVLLDDDAVFAGRPAHNPPGRPDSGSLAYLIYTSGSTGKPKGVMLEHRNVQNFFTAMDAHIPLNTDAENGGQPGTWLAVTSLSFDISVLELLWTLARGLKVVIHEDQQRAAAGAARSGKHADKAVDFSLMYFSSADTAGDNKYRLLLEGAKFADQHGFSSIWTPERHFHEFGGLYPNPAQTATAVAMVTENLKLRAGSVVTPLHHPARIAEEWAVVDNLSGGRVGIAFASGWQPRDFLLKPENFGNREVMFETLEQVQRLWRGEEVEFPGPNGQSFPARTLPQPIQKELPFWLTAAGSPETFRSAGALGAGLLTHLLGQSKEELAEKIAIYRQARRDAGHEGDGHVTLMLHTFIGDDNETVRETVREPMKSYLGSSLGLVKGFAQSWTAFKKRSDGSTDVDVDLNSLTDEELDGLLEYSFERYYETSGLFGDTERALGIVDDLKGIGIDEIACLIDFGVDEDLTLAHLSKLNRVRELSAPVAGEQAAAPATDGSIAAQIVQYGVTHLQCTPSLAVMLVQDEAARAALGQLKAMMIGGEAFPPALAAQLRACGVGTLLNMYGPTETTIWSTVHEITADDTSIPIGRPIANTTVYVLDGARQPVLPGVAGELYIGGAGVARGYLGRPELTAERFVDDPFGAQGGRLYRTGDLVRWREDGVLEFLGRIDHQVKIRGHRIELGEIEAALADLEAVREVVVMPREDVPGDVRLVAYLIAADTDAEPAPHELKEYLRGRLPEPMVPSHFIVLDSFPLTPNKKVDRKALPAPLAVAPQRAATGAGDSPANEMEAKVLAIWQEALQLPNISVADNFFDLGGHSLLAVKVHRQLNEIAEKSLLITDLFRFPTVKALAEYLAAGDGGAQSLDESQDRASRRRQAMAARRGTRKRNTSVEMPG